MANRQTRALRKLSNKEVTLYTRTEYRGGGHNSKKHKVTVEEHTHDATAYDPSRAKMKNRQRHIPSARATLMFE